jgi:hypothetical protein
MLPREILDAPISWDEAVRELGLAEAEMVLVGSAYTVEKDKDKLLSEPFYIREVRFATDPTTDNEYAVLYCVARNEAIGQVILTDGSTGIYKTINAAVQSRIAENHPSPYNGYIIPNGLRKSDYPTDSDGKPLTKQQIADGVKPGGKGTTYYFA